MNMLLALTSVVLCLTTASCSNSKFVKTAPTITNSLVNLGKMEISFYFNGKHPDDPSKSIKSPSVPATRSHSIEREPCPCNAKSSKESTSFLTNPAEIINKILKNNDLFKDPTLHCCDSHEQIEENTVFFELNAPSRTPMNLNNIKKPSLPKFPFPFQKLLNQPSMFPSMRPKAMEIFLFPKRKDMVNMDYGKPITRLPTFFPKLMTVTAVPKPVTKAEILKVGDKEITPVNAEGASVKKDLTNTIEKKIETIDNGDDLKIEPPATTVNNAL